jgi:DNA topoisomerase-1
MWLIITEKYNTAKRIAHILFKNVKGKRESGISYFTSDDAVVVGLKGHVVQLDFPEKYNNWTKVPVTSLIRGEIVKKITEKKIVNLLKKLAKKADRVTIATDYDREGELIGVEALEIIRSVNPDVSVDRVRYSAITPRDIRKAFESPTSVDFALADAAEARQIIDLIWGATLTRFLSRASNRLGKNFLSVGRVQSPTLRLIVEREKEIENFKPEPYWEIFATFEKSDTGESFLAKHVTRFDDEIQAVQAYERISDEGIAIKVTEKVVQERPPSPFNTTEFLSAASQFMSPSRAMNVAENLYMNGLISYPRTDNTVYPPSLNLKEIVKQLSKGPFSKEAELVLSRDRIIPARGRTKSEDHPPIYPTGVADKSKLSNDEWKIYELVVRRFLATLAENAVWERRHVVVESNGERLEARGSIAVKLGWREIYTYWKVKETYVPPVVEGEVLKVKDKRLEKKMTSPPPRYSPGQLIRLMEKLGLGTKSTRHEILKKLLSRTYIYGNPIKPTKVAVAVVNSLSDFADVITKPDMTKMLEEEMDQIAEGKLTKEKVVEDSRKILEEIFKTTDVEKLSQSLKQELRQELDVGPCPECEKELVIRKSKKGRFIGCSGYPNCTFTLPLPKNGRIIVTGRKCKTHSLKMIRISSKGSSWSLGCPYCNYLKWIEMRDKEGKKEKE